MIYDYGYGCDCYSKDIDVAHLEKVFRASASNTFQRLYLNHLEEYELEDDSESFADFAENYTNDQLWTGVEALVADLITDDLHNKGYAETCFESDSYIYVPVRLWDGKSKIISEEELEEFFRKWLPEDITLTYLFPNDD